MHDDQQPGWPEPILSNIVGSFAWGVFHDRNPAIVSTIGRRLPYPPDIRRALEDLAASVAGGKIEPLASDAHDYAQWRAWGSDYYGQRWYDVPFLWAESYFYRKLLDAVGYFRPGPWQGIDPFEPQKSAELTDPALDADLTALASLPSFAVHDQLTTAIDAALWGNRADLGFLLTDSTALHLAHEGDLVADDSDRLLAQLGQGTGAMCLVADNAGRELLGDLVLVDVLLRTGAADEIGLHLKPHPYYVSDATTHDLLACLRRLADTAATAEVAGRLTDAMVNGRLTVVTDAFYGTPLTYHEIPPMLAQLFASAKLTILKGDLNYRRLVADLHWPATTPFATAAGYFPGPVAALRTLKSDVVVGVTGERLAPLNAAGAAWRTSGTHGLIQVRP